LLDEAGIDGRIVRTDADRPTTHKQRLLATVEQRQPHQILRVDHERTHPLGPGLAQSLVEAIEKELPNVDAVLISDYAKGVCTPELLARVIGAARERGLPVLVDPARIGDYERYRRATLVKPNRRETELVTGRAIHSPTDALEAGRELVRRYDFQSVVVTLDGDGMVLVTADGKAEHVPTRPRQVSDITGAGDMALAVLGVCVAEESKRERVEESKGQEVAGRIGLREAVAQPQAAEELLRGDTMTTEVRFNLVEVQTPLVQPWPHPRGRLDLVGKSRILDNTI
jgi:D-beta-D-heptose 7-phosphate kinase/D-beta-D-heptose 1-phosphate adenosyltransferase